jgi:diadenylate cyclase
MQGNEEIIEILSYVAPGTRIREGLNNILDAGTGALIVIGDDENILNMVDGGFFINCSYTPQRVYELAKMDGAIILDYSAEKILYANVHMQPDSFIPTSESGTRHRTAQRVSRQTGNLVIAISEKRNRITLYKENIKYQLRNIPDIMSEANQAIKTLERYKSVLDKVLANLTLMEFDDIVTMYEVTTVLQRFEMLFRISNEVSHYIVELGTEGRLINMQLEELLKGVEEERQNFLKDYYNPEKEELNLETINDDLTKLSDEELLELENLSFILGHSKRSSSLDNKITAKGYRILGKIMRLNKKDIEGIVDSFDDLNAIQEANLEELSELKGISKFKARSIKNGIKRLKFTTELER